MSPPENCPTAGPQLLSHPLLQCHPISPAPGTVFLKHNLDPVTVTAHAPVAVNGLQSRVQTFSQNAHRSQCFGEACALEGICREACVMTALEDPPSLQWSMHPHSSCLPMCLMPGQPASFLSPSLPSSKASFGGTNLDQPPLSLSSSGPCPLPIASQGDVSVGPTISCSLALEHALLIPEVQGSHQGIPSRPGLIPAHSKCCPAHCKNVSFTLFLFDVQRPELGFKFCFLIKGHAWCQVKERTLSQ